MADRYNKLKTWTESYLFFQDLNETEDARYAALNDLDTRKLNIVDLKTSIGALTGLTLNGTVTADENSTIDGQDLLDIFEEDSENPGHIDTVVKEATHAGSADGATLADAAKGDTRFQISGKLGGSGTLSIAASTGQPLQKIMIIVPTEKKLVIKRARWYFLDSNLRLEVYSSTSWKSSSYQGDEQLNTQLATEGSRIITISADNNSSSSSITVQHFDSWWIDLAFEDV